jgi:hypothetical protein
LRFVLKSVLIKDTIRYLQKQVALAQLRGRLGRRADDRREADFRLASMACADRASSVRNAINNRWQAKPPTLPRNALASRVFQRGDPLLSQRVRDIIFI